jgi:hypothetical protein
MLSPTRPSSRKADRMLMIRIGKTADGVVI